MKMTAVQMQGDKRSSLLYFGETPPAAVYTRIEIVMDANCSFPFPQSTFYNAQGFKVDVHNKEHSPPK